MKKFINRLFLIIIIVVITLVLFTLKIKNINVIGNSNVENSYIIKELIHNDYDRNLIIFLIRNIFFKNNDLPLIEDYKIKLKGISEVEIIVKERIPICFMKVDLKRVLIDEKGYVVNIIDDNVSLPEVIGLNFLFPVKSEKLQIVDNIDFLQIARIITLLLKNGINLDLIEFDRSRELNLYIGKIVVKFGVINNIDIKLDRLIKIYDKVSDYKGILDMRNVYKNDMNEEYIFKKIN